MDFNMDVLWDGKFRINISTIKMKISITIEANTQEELFKRMDEIKFAINDELFEELMDGSLKVNNSTIEFDDEYEERVNTTCL